MGISKTLLRLAEATNSLEALSLRCNPLLIKMMIIPRRNLNLCKKLNRLSRSVNESYSKKQNRIQSRNANVRVRQRENLQPGTQPDKIKSDCADKITKSLKNSTTL